MRFLVIALLASCATASQVGPYVKHIARNGDWLVIHKCIIVLEDKDLHEEGCTVEQLPLAALPQMQMPPQQMPPQQMPPQGQQVPQPLPPGQPQSPPPTPRR